MDLLLCESRCLLAHEGTNDEYTPPKVFKASHLHGVGGSSGLGGEQHHWTSKPLQDGHYLQRITFRYKNQGRLWLSLHSPSPDNDHTVTTPKARRCFALNAGHGWSRFMEKLNLRNPLRRLARAGDRYTLTYTTEIGKRRPLRVEQFVLQFEGELSRFGTCSHHNLSESLPHSPPKSPSNHSNCQGRMYA